MHLSILLTTAPLDPATLLAAVTHPDAGGIATFLGTTRAETDPAKGPLLELDYAAYPEMAEKELHRLATAAGQHWPILAAAIHHRLGPVRIGESSMIVAIATPHRQDAFDACRWLVDELKKTVPIWKQERYQTATRWQGDPSPA